MNNNKLGEYISFLRNDKGWSQRELARRCEVSSTQIQRIENNEIESPGLQFILSLARALDVHPVKLILAFQGRESDKVTEGMDNEMLTDELKDAFSQFLEWRKSKP